MKKQSSNERKRETKSDGNLTKKPTKEKTNKEMIRNIS